MANIRDFEEKLFVRFSRGEKSEYTLSYPLDMCTELAKSQALDLAAQELRIVGSNINCDIVECAWQDGTQAILVITSPLAYVCSFTRDKHVQI